MEGEAQDTNVCNIGNKPLNRPRKAVIEDRHYYIAYAETGTRTLYHERWIGGTCFHVCKAVSMSRCGEPYRSSSSEQTKK